jgi:hypothetical protein
VEGFCSFNMAVWRNPVKTIPVQCPYKWEKHFYT